jgi:hypothetical protein
VMLGEECMGWGVGEDEELDLVWMDRGICT